jgi:hypothetical protein
MKLFAQLKNGLPINVDIQNAIDGFQYLGYDIVGFTLEDILSGKMDIKSEQNPFIGSIDGMTILFNNVNKYPEPIDFPESIINSGLLNREIVSMKLNDFVDSFKRTKKPMFVKPVQTKLFDGALISKEENLSYLRLENCDVLVCEPIEILSEHRVYVHNKKAIYSCNYCGNFRINPNFDYIDKLIEAYKNQPISYTIDVAVLKDGSMTVIEFNDFWAIGGYGLYCVDYAQMLHDRYFEIINS